MSNYGRFCRTVILSGLSAATLVAATASPVRAQAAAAANSNQVSTVPSSPASPVGNAATVDSGASSQQNLTSKAIEKVKEAAKKAADIFSRVPCLPSKSSGKHSGSLPHVASKLAANEPIVIVAFGSSSTAGAGATGPDYTYPSRLAVLLRREYPVAEISVINRGQNGEDAPEMMKRLKTSVLDLKPDLVIWQVGTNAVLRNLDPSATADMVEEGIALIQAAGSDLVLVDPQFAPRVNEKMESASKMVQLLAKVASFRHVGVFPRFEVMREWHEVGSLPFDSFVSSDGLHMNDWGYACFAQLLGDDIIKSVGQVQLGVNMPSKVLTYRPM